MAPKHLNIFLFINVMLVLIWIIQDVDGCFITNCPRKRSVMNAASAAATAIGTPNHMPRECTRCGPALTGRCFGPNICCSPLIGCNIGGFAATRCALEAYSPTLCINPGSSCGPDRKGICALNSTCCTNDGCFMDKSCSDSNPSSQNNDFNL